MKKLLFITLSFLVMAPLFAGNDPDDIIGIWENGSGKGHIQIYKENGKYCGRITWLRDGKDELGKEKLDRKNPNTSLRSRPLRGLTMLHGFSFDEGEYTGGRIYNPSDGKEYKAYMKLKDSNNLSVRGYVGFSFFGKTDHWKRVK